MLQRHSNYLLNKSRGNVSGKHTRESFYRKSKSVEQQEPTPFPHLSSTESNPDLEDEAMTQKSYTENWGYDSYTHSGEGE